MWDLKKIKLYVPPEMKLLIPLSQQGKSWVIAGSTRGVDPAIKITWLG